MIAACACNVASRGLYLYDHHNRRHQPRRMTGDWNLANRK